MISAYTYVLFITMGKALWTFNCNKAHTAVTVPPRIFSKYTLMHSTMYHVLNRKLLGLEHVALYKHTQQGVPFSHLKCTPSSGMLFQTLHNFKCTRKHHQGNRGDVKKLFCITKIYV